MPPHESSSSAATASGRRRRRGPTVHPVREQTTAEQRAAVQQPAALSVTRVECPTCGKVRVGASVVTIATIRNETGREEHKACYCDHCGVLYDFWLFVAIDGTAAHITQCKTTRSHREIDLFLAQYPQARGIVDP